MYADGLPVFANVTPYNDERRRTANPLWVPMSRLSTARVVSNVQRLVPDMLAHYGCGVKWDRGRIMLPLERTQPAPRICHISRKLFVLSEVLRVLKPKLSLPKYPHPVSRPFFHLVAHSIGIIGERAIVSVPSR